MVITDSQAFGPVAKATPRDIPLTSFSILMARYKGFLTDAVKGVAAIDTLADGDRVLIAEGCTHHRQCEDIGTVKIPRWLKEYTGKELSLEHCSGRDFPEDLSPYKLIIHCGGCMLGDPGDRLPAENRRRQRGPLYQLRNHHRPPEGHLKAQPGAVPGPARPAALRHSPKTSKKILDNGECWCYSYYNQST